jgi:hypothetical protein
VTAYRLEIVTSGIPEPLHTETFEALDDVAAVREARKRLPELVTNPLEEYGILTAGNEWVADIDVSRGEDAR